MQETNIQELQQEVREASGIFRTIKIEVAKVLVGQEGLVDSLLIGLICNGHILVEGLPGLAKTLAIKTLAQAVGGTFARLQFTPDLLPADLTGTTIYNPADHTFAVKRGPIFANIILADEINRAPAKVQSALLEAMQEHQVTLGGETHPLPEPFLVMATQNPIEQEGTYPLPEAQVDRFMLKTVITYPTRQEEQQILERMGHPEVTLETIRVVELSDILAARDCVDRIYFDPKVKEYILDLVFASRGMGTENLSERQHDAQLEELGGLIEYGASPRATLALGLGAKAAAFLAGRAYVVPQDVKDVAPAVLRHRIIPTYEAEAENLTGDDIVQKLLDELRTP